MVGWEGRVEGTTGVTDTLSTDKQGMGQHTNTQTIIYNMQYFLSKHFGG